MGLFVVWLILVGLIVLISIFIARLLDLSREVGLLRGEVARLRSGVDSIQVAMAIKEPEAAGPQDPWTIAAQQRAAATPAQQPAAVAAQGDPRLFSPQTPQTLTRAQTPQPQVWRTNVKPPSKWKGEWERVIGERVLNRIGALALIIGAGLFLKYAFDHDWISPLVRVLMGLTGGAALVYGASRQREKLPIFSQGILASGLVILYLSVYASYNFYRLVPQVVAVLGMALVTILSFERGVRFDSLAVGLIGWAGGFLTPVLLQGGGATPEGFFAYLVLLNAGLLGLVAWRKKWWVLEPISLAATYISYSVWFARDYRPQLVSIAAIFLVLIWALYYSIEGYRLAQSVEEHKALRNVVGTFNLGFLVGALTEIMGTDSTTLATIVTLLAVAYAAPLVALRRSTIPFALKSVFMALVATRLWLTLEGTVPVWTVIGIALVYLGSKTDIRHLRVTGAAVLGVSLLTAPATKDFFERGQFDQLDPLLSPRLLVLLTVAVLGAVAGRIYRKSEGPDVTWAAPMVNYGWIAAGAFLLSNLSFNYFQWLGARAGINPSDLLYPTAITVGAVWICYSIPLAWYARTKAVPSIHHGALTVYLFAFLTVVGTCFAYVPIEAFRLVINPRFAVVLVAIAGSILHSRIIRQAGYRWSPQAGMVLDATTGLLAFAGVTAEAKDFYARLIALEKSPIRLDALRNSQQLAISGVWLAYSIIAMAAGFWRRKRGLRIAAIALFALTILKVFLYDLSYLPGLYRIVSLGALGVILLATSYVYTKYRDKIFGPDVQTAEG
ncbi:MAG TPA: DUF2339 domain-containing protein [Actinomycetota bacterium]|nr:DUF2339 domain-containing protein [Actinomycetota bacterium]